MNATDVALYVPRGPGRPPLLRTSRIGWSYETGEALARAIGGAFAVVDGRRHLYEAKFDGVFEPLDVASFLVTPVDGGAGTIAGVDVGRAAASAMAEAQATARTLADAGVAVEVLVGIAFT